MNRIRGEQPFALQRVFISYTREDEPFAQALEKRFDEKGVRYWRDVHDLKAGRLDRQIDRAITLHPLVLVVLSERSVASPWVEWEVARAEEMRREVLKGGGEARDVLCPVALDHSWKTCDWSAELRARVMKHHILDFSAWQEDAAFAEAFGRLYEGLILHYGAAQDGAG